MKKYIFQFVVTLFAITSFTLVACSDDDDDPTNNNGRNSIEINGVSYNLSAFSFMGDWNETLRKGDFTVAVDNESNGVINVDYYTFSYHNATCPQVGDDFAEMDLALTPLIEEEEGSIIDLEDSFKYVSGTAVVTYTNPSESEITVNFDNLTMSNGSSSYTFKGTATLMFEY